MEGKTEATAVYDSWQLNCSFFLFSFLLIFLPFDTYSSSKRDERRAIFVSKTFVHQTPFLHFPPSIMILYEENRHQERHLTRNVSLVVLINPMFILTPIWYHISSQWLWLSHLVNMNEGMDNLKGIAWVIIVTLFALNPDAICLMSRLAKLSLFSRWLHFFLSFGCYFCQSQNFSFPRDFNSFFMQIPGDSLDDDSCREWWKKSLLSCHFWIPKSLSLSLL